MSDDRVKEAAIGLDIKHFKLTNGESILGIIKSFENGLLVVEGALELLESWEDDTYRYGFKQWFEFNPTDDTTIFKSSLVAMSDINNDIKESYLKTIISMGTDEISNDPLPDIITSDMTCH